MNSTPILKMIILSSALALLQLPVQCWSLTLSSLTPQTTPEDIVRAQLDALQRDDMQGVFDFASPSNKANFNNGDLATFDRMVRYGMAYSCLIGHEEATLLLTTTWRRRRWRTTQKTTTTPMTPTNEIWQGLVRVVSSKRDTTHKRKYSDMIMAKDEDDDDEDDKDDDDVQDVDDSKQTKDQIKEFWWTVTRCKTGPYEDCFMMDAVMPNN